MCELDDAVNSHQRGNEEQPQDDHRFCELVGVLLCMFWQFGAKLARVQSTARQDQQQQQQHGSGLLPQSVFKRVSRPHSDLDSFCFLM